MRAAAHTLLFYGEQRSVMREQREKEKTDKRH
jgi:hypothetical protein